MSDWSGNDYLNELSRRPAAAAPSTPGDIWNAEWSRAGLDTIDGVGRPMEEARQELEDAISGGAGMDLTDYAAQKGINLTAGRNFDERTALLGQLAGTLPDEAKKKIEPLLDIRKNAAQKAQKIEVDANDVAASTYGLSGTATAWLAGLVRQTFDPVNLAAMAITAPIGGPWEGAIGKVLLRQAGAAAAAQAAVEPMVEPARAELGLDSGFKRAASNIAGAAVGGAALTGLFRGAGYALRVFRGRGIEAPAPEARPEPQPGEPAQPFEPQPLSPFSHEDFAGLDRGGPLPPNYHEPGIAVGATEAPTFVGGNLDIAGGAQARPQRGRVFYDPGPSDYRPTDFTHEDFAALDRGERTPALSDEPGLGAAGDLSGFGHNLDFADGVRAMRQFAPDDLEAAANIAERDHVMSAALGEEATAGAAMAHDEKINAAADSLEAGPEEAPPPPAAKKRFGRAVQDPATFSALEYLAFRGGIRSDDRLLPDLMAALGENPFIPGFGKLIRKPVLERSSARAGSAPFGIDEAITVLKEGGYLFDPADHSGGPSQLSHTDVLAIADAEARGKKQYRLDYQPTPTRDPAAEKEFREQQRAAATTKFEARMGELQITDMRKADRTRAIEIMHREGVDDPLAAYEQALLESDQRQEAIRAERQAQAIELPGWDVLDDAGGAPAAGGRPAAEPSGEPVGAGERGAARGDGERNRETDGGTVGDPQLSADTARALQAAGPDFIIELPDGRRMTARDALAQAEEDAAAAAEFKNCAGGGTVDGGSGEIPF